MKNNYRQIHFVSPSLSYRNASMVIDILPNRKSHHSEIQWFIKDKLFYNTKDYLNFKEITWKVNRTNILQKGNLILSTPEHLAPVFLLWNQKRFSIHLESGSELPLMDGSALPFFLRLRNFLGEPEKLIFYETPLNTAWEIKNALGDIYGVVKIYPAETFEVEYILDRKEDNFSSSASVSIYSAEDLFPLFMARTFILKSDFQKAREEGLLKGVDEHSGMMIGDITEGYRIKEEPAMHKILDLIGDLCFVYPALPKIHIEIVNGGHCSHRQILEKILTFLKF